MSSCIIVDGWDGPDVFREEVRRARKEYKCCECGEKILPGDVHGYATGCWEGDWLTYRTCARCQLVADDYFDGRAFGAMVEYFKEAHGMDYREGIPPHIVPCHA